jgi:DNA-binding transcriptional regulator YiaG
VETQTSDPAALIREVRNRLGLTQEKFAAKLGVTLPTINRWENRRTKPSPLAIKNLKDLIAGMGPEGKDLISRCST